jgi:hypothetical protein
MLMTYFIYDEHGFIWAVYDDMFTMLADYVDLLKTGQEWHYDAVTFDLKLLGKWATFSTVYGNDIVQ